MTLQERMKILTKATYLICLLGLVFIPLVVWAMDTSVDLTGIGAFAAGVGVPMGTLTVALAVRGNGRTRPAQSTEV